MTLSQMFLYVQKDGEGKKKKKNPVINYICLTFQKGFLSFCHLQTSMRCTM